VRVYDQNRNSLDAIATDAPMPQKTNSPNPTVDDIANEIRAELRCILRARRDLYTPLERFEPITDSDGTTRYYVLFDMNRRIRFQGLKLGGLKTYTVPDERIYDRILEFAKAVWHLKDRLYQYAKASKQPVDVDHVAKQSSDLLVCADLANKKKHGRNENRSQLDPHLGLVSFDTSKNGTIEMYYDGAMKDKELIVAKPVPIPYSVDILDQDDTIIGDARVVINRGFNDWLPLIRQLGILSADDRETNALRSIFLTKRIQMRNNQALHASGRHRRS